VVYRYLVITQNLLNITEPDKKLKSI